MGRVLPSVCSAVTFLALGFLIEPLFPLGDWRWGCIAFVAMLPAAVLYRRELLKLIPRKRLHHSVSPDPVYIHFHVSEPSVTVTRRPRFWREPIRWFRWIMRQTS